MFCVTIPVSMTWAGGIELTVGWIPIAAAAATALVGVALGMGRAVRVSRADRADKQVTILLCSESSTVLPVANQRLSSKPPSPFHVSVTPTSRGGDQPQCASDTGWLHRCSPTSISLISAAVAFADEVAAQGRQERRALLRCHGRGHAHT